jgi:hypothetical protein
LTFCAKLAVHAKNNAEASAVNATDVDFITLLPTAIDENK